MLRASEPCWQEPREGKLEELITTKEEIKLERMTYALGMVFVNKRELIW